MTRKIIASAIAALAIGTFTAAPRIAEATQTPVVVSGGVSVTADVLPTTTVAVTSPAANTNWDGSSAISMQFEMTVVSNDTLGYTFTFTGGHSGFHVAGVSNTQVAYTIYDEASTPVQYFSGTAGGILSTLSTYSTTGTSTGTYFDVRIAAQSPALPADTYSDTIVATITPQ